MKPIYGFFALMLVFAVGCNGQTWQNKQTRTEEKIQEKKDVADMKLTSTEFIHNGAIPPEFTCDSSGVSPPLSISDAPQSAKSLALVMDDPDAPAGTWDHWVVFNIPPHTKQSSKGAEPGGVKGKNSWGRTGYGGPCPPSGTHRYFFKLYALDLMLDLPEGSSKKDLERAMGGHILEKAELIGTYKRR